MMILILWTVKDRGANVDGPAGTLVTETFPYDGGRTVTVYVAGSARGGRLRR